MAGLPPLSQAGHPASELLAAGAGLVCRWRGQRQLCAEVMEAVPDLRREFVGAMAVDNHRRNLGGVPVSRSRPLLVDDDRAAGDITARCDDLDPAAGRWRGRSRARLRLRGLHGGAGCMSPGSRVGEVRPGCGTVRPEHGGRPGCGRLGGVQ
jgi:hypothetical protein